MNHYIRLAKVTIEKYITTKKILDIPAGLPEDFYSRRAGVFVTIYNSGDLRGCIGTYLPTQENIAAEIISNAVSACSRDYRFDKIIADELQLLSYEVSILSEPEFVDDINKLDAKKYGVLVTTQSGKSGLLLPGLDGVDSVEEQISISCQKGGIDRKKEKINIYSFTVEKYF